jgi:hypothetical protein
VAFLPAMSAVQADAGAASASIVMATQSLDIPYRRLPYKKPEESRTQSFYKPKRNLKPRAGLGSALLGNALRLRVH